MFLQLSIFFSFKKCFIKERLAIFSGKHNWNYQVLSYFMIIYISSSFFLFFLFFNNQNKSSIHFYCFMQKVYRGFPISNKCRYSFYLIKKVSLAISASFIIFNYHSPIVGNLSIFEHIIILLPLSYIKTKFHDFFPAIYPLVPR